MSTAQALPATLPAVLIPYPVRPVRTPRGWANARALPKGRVYR